MKDVAAAVVTLTFGIIWPMNASAVLGCARKERTCSSFLLFRGVTRSLGVESHVVGAARDLDIVPVDHGVVVRALHVHVTADGAKVLLVEGKIGGTASHANPRGDAIGAVDGHVAGSPKNAHWDGAQGSGELYFDPTGPSG